MALHYRTCGFIIKKNDIAEDDRIFTIFSQDFGKIQVLGKAIRKIASKLKNGIDIFYLSEIEFIQGKTRKTLTDSIALNKFRNIKKDLNKLKIVYKIADVLNNLIGNEEKDGKIWDLLNESFDWLNNCKIEIENSLETENHKLKIVYYYFLWNFFYVLGYKPELFYCAVCQKKLNPNNLYFSSDQGGVICDFCLNKKEKFKKINSDLVKILRIILKKDWPTLSKLKIQPFSQELLKDTSEYYYSYLLSIYSYGENT